jgi:hypothetical protein
MKLVLAVAWPSSPAMTTVFHSDALVVPFASRAAKRGGVDGRGDGSAPGLGLLVEAGVTAALALGDGPGKCASAECVGRGPQAVTNKRPAHNQRMKLERRADEFSYAETV